MRLSRLCMIACVCFINVLAQQTDTLNRKSQRLPRRSASAVQMLDKHHQKEAILVQQPKMPQTNQPTTLPENSIRVISPDLLVVEPDTVSSQTVSIPREEIVAKKNTELPVGAKDTTTLNFRDADLRDIFRALAVQHKLNVYVDNSINTKSTLSLSRVTVYEAMKFICEQNNLRLQVDGGIFKIAPMPAVPKVEQPQKIPWIYYEKNLLSVQLKNDDLDAVVDEIHKKSGKNILVLSGTSGTLDGTLSDIDFDTGFAQLLNINGYALQKKNSIYTISRSDYFVGQQTGTQSQKSGAYWISVKDSLVTIDVTNAQLERVLSDIIRQLNTDVIFYNPVTGTVTARATNLPLAKTLDMLLRNTNFSYRESEGMYFVGEKTNKSLMATKLFKLKYLRSEKILDMVPQSISAQATLKVLKEHNGIVVMGSGDAITQVEEFLQQIDKPVAQVLIEAIVVDYNRNKGFNLGVNAGYRGSSDSARNGSRSDVLIPGIDLLFSGGAVNNALQAAGAANIGKLPDNFFVQLKAMEQKGLANIKSRPLIATLNGCPASLSIGTTYYFKLSTTTPFQQNLSQTYLATSEQFTTVDADTKLEITPYVGADGQITVDLKPDFKRPLTEPINGIPPTISRRAMSSTLVIKEGETIVLGGMIEESESETRTQVPILGSIPLLGYLFSSTSKSTNKSELIIYITPHISYGEAFQNVSLSIHEE